MQQGNAPKGDVLGVARTAGILAAKRTSDLIPLCHPLRLTRVEVSFDVRPRRGEVTVEARVRTVDKTGVEMEALTAAAVAALTVYDMVKALEKGVTITNLQLLTKSGGKSGDWQRSRTPHLERPTHGPSRPRGPRYDEPGPSRTGHPRPKPASRRSLQQ